MVKNLLDVWFVPTLGFMQLSILNFFFEVLLHLTDTHSCIFSEVSHNSTTRFTLQNDFFFFPLEFLNIFPEQSLCS